MTIPTFTRGRARDRLAPVLLVLLVLATASAAACGGKGVVDGTSGGTGGGQAMSSSSSGGEATICEAFCDVEVMNGCEKDVSSCVAGCQGKLENVGICADALTARLACDAKEEAGTSFCAVDGPPPCPELAQAFDACVIPGAVIGDLDEICTVDSTCHCKAHIPVLEFAVDCAGTDPVTCTCTKNGQVLGSCAPPQNMGMDLVCDVFVGCCAQTFALNH